MSARVLAIPARNEAPTPDPSPEHAAAHLQRLLETQPCCLMRVGVDGLLLAANEAALSLLGARELGDAVGTNLSDRIAGHQAAEWRDFVKRVWDGAPGSLECDITTGSDVLKSVLFQAVPLHGHPDDIPSLLLTARDIVANRRVESTLIDEHQLATLLASRADEARAEQQRLTAMVERRDEELARREADLAALQQAIADEHGRVEALEQEAGELAVVRAQLAGALAQRAELETSLERRDAEYQELVAQQAIERVRLQEAAADELAQLQDAAAAERTALQETIAAERARAQALEQQAKELAETQRALEAARDEAAADADDLKALLLQHETTLKDLRNKLVNSAGERTRLDTLLKQQEAEAARAHAEVVKALADQKLELDVLAENLRTIEPLAAAGRLAAGVHAELQDVLALIARRAGGLIERCALDAIDRGEIESLRRETARAASLARQVRPPNAEA